MGLRDGRLFAESERLAVILKQKGKKMGIAEHGIKSAGRRYVPLIQSLARKYGIPEVLISHQMYRESGFRPDVVSPRGAIGLMQIMPETALEIAGRHGLPAGPLTDPTVNAELGVAFMRELYDTAYGQVKDKRRAYELALVGYWAGPGRMRSIMAGGSMTEAERRYVNNIVWDYEKTESWNQLPTPARVKERKGLFAALFSFPVLLIAGIGYVVYKKKKK